MIMKIPMTALSFFFQFLDTSKDPTKNPKEELQKKHFVQSMALFQKKTKAQEVSN